MARKKATPEPPPEPPDPEGGEGGSPVPRPQRDALADLKLYRYAIQQGWPVSADLKARTLERLSQMIDNPKGGDRAWTAAARTLVSMTTATTGAISTAIQARQHEELADTVRELREWKESISSEGSGHVPGE